MFKEPDVETWGLLHTAKGMTELAMHFSIILFFQPSYIRGSSFGLMIKILRAFNTASIQYCEHWIHLKPHTGAAAKLVLKKMPFCCFSSKKENMKGYTIWVWQMILKSKGDERQWIKYKQYLLLKFSGFFFFATLKKVQIHNLFCSVSIVLIQTKQTIIVI